MRIFLAVLTSSLLLVTPPVDAQEKPNLVIGGEDDRIMQLGSTPRLIIVKDRVIILDAQAPFIRVIGANGKLQQSLGRHGAGPGEFGRSFDAAFDSVNSQLVVFDRDNSRLSLFSLGDTLTFVTARAVGQSPIGGCVIGGVAWQTVLGPFFLRQLERSGNRFTLGRSVGAVKWFNPATKNEMVGTLASQVMLACNAEHRIALVVPMVIPEAHLISLTDGKQQHLRLLDVRPMDVSGHKSVKDGVPSGGVEMRIPADGIFDEVQGLLTTPLGLEVVVSRRTPWVKGKEDVATYRRILISPDGAQSVVAQSSWRPIAVATNGAYCYQENPYPLVARFASGRCP